MVSEGYVEFVIEKPMPWKGTEVMVEYSSIKRIGPREFILEYLFVDWN